MDSLDFFFSIGLNLTKNRLTNRNNSMKLLTFVSVLLLLLSFVASEELLGQNIFQIQDFTGGAVAQENDDEAETEDLGSIVKCEAIYGQYCGPGWCAGKWWSTCPNGKSPTPPVSECDTNQPAQDPVDQCCQGHDACCINARKTNPPEGECACDQNLVKCLSTAPCGGFKCGVSKNAIMAFFKTRGTLSNKCC